MVPFGKLLRWFFGLNSILFAAIAARYAMVFPPLITHIWNGAGESALRLAAYGVLAGLYGQAFVWLGRGGKVARRWALLGSVLNLPFYWVVQQAWLWSAAGAVGLVIFSQLETVNAMATRRVRAPRARGDGTSNSIDAMANLVLFLGFLGAGFLWSQWANSVHLPMNDGVLVRLLLIEAAMLITTLVHESGHALAAVLVKMKVRRFLVGPVEGFFRSGKWDLKFRLAGLLGAPGGLGVVPASLDNLRNRHAIVTAAGPLASLIVGLLTAWIALSAKGHTWEAAWMWAAYTSTFSLLSFAFNLIPMRPDSVYSDGARIYQLLTRSPWSDVHLALSMGSCTMASPMRPRDCDAAVLERAARFLTKGMEALILRVQMVRHFHDCGQIPEAVDALEQAEAIYAESISDLRVDLHKSFVFANAFLKQDALRARQWWDRMMDKGGATRDAEYWMSLCALMWVERAWEEAESAHRMAASLIADLPHVGAHDYERDCIRHLRAAISQELPHWAAAC